MLIRVVLWTGFDYNFSIPKNAFAHRGDPPIRRKNITEWQPIPKESGHNSNRSGAVKPQLRKRSRGIIYMHLEDWG